MTESAKRKRKFGFGIKNNYILPNMVTLLGLLSGVFAVMHAINGGSIFQCALLLLLASIFDMLDGKIARLLNATSEFGVQLDSLCDAISFGVAPALVAYIWLDEPFGRVGVLAVFLYIACGVLRLARFNVFAGKISSDYFIGLPIPVASGFIASIILFTETHGATIDQGIIAVVVIGVMFMLSFLMVSPVPFYSFKNVPFFRKHPYNSLIIFLVLLITVVMFYEVALFVVGVLYVGIGLLTGLRRLAKKDDALSDTGEGVEEHSS